MTAETVARALGGRRSGRGYVACCPAHEDRSPSLSIADGDQTVLVHCHAGCDQMAVIDALRARGLWPERERPDWTPEERQRWVEEWRKIERDLPNARYWRRAAANMTEGLLCTMKAALFSPDEPQPGPRDIQDITGMLERLQRLGDAELVTEFQWWLEHHPGQTAAMVAWARRAERSERKALAAFLAAKGE